MIRTSKFFGAFLVAIAAASCGKAKTKTVYVNNPNPNNQTNYQFPADTARQMDLLAVEISNFAQVNAQSISNGSQVEFRLKSAQTQIPGVRYKCVVEQSGRTGTTQPEDCSSPYVVDVQEAGQYRLTVYAVHPQATVPGHAAQVNFAVGQVAGGGMGSTNYAQKAVVQVGDLFLVTVPRGMHTVYRTSTFDQPGTIKRRMIDASMGDTASPYPVSCGQGANSAAGTFQSMVPDVSPMGQQLQYCETSMPVNYNAPGDYTMSYNSLALSTDASFGPQVQNNCCGDVPSSMYINVFTQVPGARPLNQFQAQFSNEFRATASRMQLSCGANLPEYLGTAEIFQGYYAGQSAGSNLFGCTSKRNGKTYVNVAAFLIDQVNPVNRVPTCDWRCMQAQGLSNQRAAEIVVEFGPFNDEVTARGQVRKAQELMRNSIQKVTP
jgi:hypothetical protein